MMRHLVVGTLVKEAPRVIAATTTGVALALVTGATASAANFLPFSFQTNVTASPNTTGNPNLLNDPTRDVRLDSVVFNGLTVGQFDLVNSATVIRNDTYFNAADGEAYGILHAGQGPNTAIDPLVGEGPAKPNPTGQDIADTLGNLNLNSILVTRENGDSAIIGVSFVRPVNTFFFWERGGTPGGTLAGDSDLLVEALADDGVTVLASYKILRANYTKADYNISTIVPPVLNNGPFNIGSIGIRLDGIYTRNLRLTSAGNNLGATSGDNGPDFKVIAADVTVPEPGTVLATLAVASIGIVWKRERR
ncbi:exosortase-dependent surface protein XDP2 [Pannus brasiliensis CCIBt3594]|uniref:Exosortase-dependent surface protein XDP2 n=1 Tax=Pannus brasiliensis CCIBt3594 TaxID=1427578 RepID=A0AAW9QK62_9CHRO